MRREQVILVSVFGLSAWLAVSGCSRESGKGKGKAKARTSRPARKARPPRPRPPTLGERLAGVTSLPEVIDLLRPHMSNSFNEFSNAAQVFAVWWMTSPVKVEDIKALPKTTYRRVMKDPEEERGKRICVRARVIEIHAHRGIEGKYYTGGLIRGYSQIYRFIALGSTGDIVQRSVARFCGVVMGTQSYMNSGGGTSHGVELVGMFDLKENRRASN